MKNMRIKLKRKSDDISFSLNFVYALTLNESKNKSVYFDAK